MKLALLTFSLFLLMTEMAQSKTWEHCQLETNNGSTTITMSSLIHETFEHEYLIDYAISGKYESQNRINVMVKKSNNSIRYTNDQEDFDLFIQCDLNQCSGSIKTTEGVLKNLKVNCQFNIPYTEPRGSAGRCGGRRC